MAKTTELRNWKIDGWGLLRGLVLLFSSFMAITILHYFVLAFYRG